MNIGDFHSVATMIVEPGYGVSWRRCPVLEIETTIYLRNLDGNGIEDDTKVGTMKLLKVNKNDEVYEVLDNIRSEDAQVGEVLDLLLNGDEKGRDDVWDENVFLSGDPYVLTRFDVEPEWRGKRLGHIILHIGLQGSGCEGHPVLLLPSNNDKDSGREFLTKFYLDGEQHSYVVKGTDVVVYSTYNDGCSVETNREELGKDV